MNPRPTQPADSDAKVDQADQSADDELVEVTADRQSKDGDLYIYDGYVNAIQADLRLQADHVTLDNATGDMVAEGNVIFDQGPDQRVTAKRAELNWTTRRGRFWETTGFTNRTQTGDYVFFTAARVDKVGIDTYELYDAIVTACEDVIPKWTFRARRAELKMGDRVTLHNSVFRVKTLPLFALPYMWIPATRKERKSGFLLPNTGSSNQKGRTFKAAYYQTLGDSADVTLRGDIYTSRGIGLGADFRAQTDEKSHMRIGVFSVKDRLFGPPGENEGGTAVIGEGIQYLPHGWLAVGSMSLVTSLRFRQVFSDDIRQVIDPRRESNFYANNNTNGFSVNFLASNESTTLFRPSADLAQPNTGSEVDVSIRQAPELDLNLYPRRILSKLPIYFSIESSAGALKRSESVDGNTILVTPAAVQRFDLQPKVTIPIATFGGIAITPSVAFRETFYTSSIDPQVPRFDADKFTLNPADPRLDPNSPEYKPGLALFDRQNFDPIIPKNISRRYAELAVDIRPPALEKSYTDEGGGERFKHVIESYITYRRIAGIGEQFAKTVRFDERDAVADTNEFEYALVNRFFVKRGASAVTTKKRKRVRGGSSVEIKPVRPEKDKDKPNEQSEPNTKQENPAAVPAEQSPDKQKIEQGQKADLGSGDVTAKAQQAGSASPNAEPEELNPQPYETLMVKLAQKYFFDRDFGGALVEGTRNQFYPINTLSGFTFGGVKRAFSPVNVTVRYRPLASVYADMRMDVGASGEGVRSLTLGGGFRKNNITISSSYYLSRRIELDPARFEAGTFPGSQVVTALQFGNDSRGMYGGTRIGYDFTDRFTDVQEISHGRLRNSRSYVGYSWDCCGVQFNYNTFKAGLRNESAFSFSFTLAGLGSFGSDQLSQVASGQGGGRRGKRRKNASFDDEDLP